MVWGPMIAWYLFLAGASAGAFLTSTFVEAKYPESVKMRVAGRIIAPIFVGIGLLMLMLDAEAGLHNPLRFFWLISNPGSVMTLGVYFICVYMPVALAVAVLEILKKRVPKWLTWIGIVAAFAVAAISVILSPTPQGVGVVEAAVVVAFTSFGESSAAGLSIALVYRGIVFWMPFLIGAILIQTTKTFKHDAKRAVRDQKGKGLRR